MKNKINNNVSSNIISNKRKFITSYKKIDYSYVKAKVETGLSEDAIKRLLNNNKKLTNKENTNKLKKNTKIGLFKKCETNLNKTIETSKKTASNNKKIIQKKQK